MGVAESQRPGFTATNPQASESITSQDATDEISQETTATLTVPVKHNSSGDDAAAVTVDYAKYEGRKFECHVQR